jgi:hypothetical protein
MVLVLRQAQDDAVVADPGGDRRHPPDDVAGFQLPAFIAFAHLIGLPAS